ncbi:MAG: hypothetical protein AAF481_03300 [Acidobacteriota bacterium]
MENDPSPPASAPRGLRSATFYSVLASLCPWIPLPWIDDWALRVVRRSQAKDCLRAVDAPVNDLKLRAATGTEGESGSGCWRTLLLWPVFRLIGYLIRKLFRKFLFILTIHDSTHRGAEVLCEGLLLRRAAVRGALNGGVGGDTGVEEARRVRSAIEATLEEVDPLPLRRSVRGALSGSGRLLRRGARLLRRSFRRGDEDPDLPIAEEEALLRPVVDRVEAAVDGQLPYLRAMEARFDEILDATAGGPAGGGNGV